MNSFTEFGDSQVGAVILSRIISKSKESIRRKWISFPYVIDFAASQASAEVSILKYLNDEGFYALTNAIDSAALRGNLKVIQYLLANRKEGFTITGIRNAMENGFVEVAQTLLQRAKFPVNINSLELVGYAWKSLNIDCIELVEEPPAFSVVLELGINKVCDIS
jgi:hypothetical protein